MLDEYTEEYIIPYSQTKIGAREFSHCIDLVRLYIPYYVEEIPDSNFFDRSKVFKRPLQKTGFKICGERGTPAEAYANKAGILFEETTMWIQDNNILKAYFGKADRVVIPDEVETIEFRAFQYAPQTSNIQFYETVKYIGSEAFAGCSLENIIIPKGIKSLGSRVFKNCSKLSCVTFENSDVDLDNDCFLGCQKDLVIKAPVGSTVEKYAERYQIKFESI